MKNGDNFLDHGVVGFNIHSTHHRLFQRQSSQPFIWLPQKPSLSNQPLGWY